VRRSKAEAYLITWAIIIGLPIYFISKAVETDRLWGLIGRLSIIAGIVVLYRAVIWMIKKDSLMDKYQDDSLVSKLMKRDIWVGQTSEQLLDSLGKPQDIDEKFLMTKKKEIWKYNHKSGNRFGLRITLDNDVVVGWDHKW